MSLSETPRSITAIDNQSNSVDSSSKCHRQTLEEAQPSDSCNPVLSPAKERLDSSPIRPYQDSRASRKLLFSPSDREEQRTAQLGLSFSPTSGLPNFVVDGTAPHLQNSPRKSKENLDWLTMMRKRKGVVEESPSPKSRKTPSRRTSRLRAAELRKAPKSFMPAITNFYSNLEGAKLPSPCSS